MPNFEISDAAAGAVFVSLPNGDFVVPAKGSIEVTEDVAVELRHLALVNEITEAAPVADAPVEVAPAEKPAKESK
jgi:autotransporter translocation and assembly factor TamB